MPFVIGLGQKLPDNLRFVAACNPFQFIKKGSSPDEELACVFESPEFEEIRLSHNVFPLKNTLTNFVWNFGALSESIEKENLRAMCKHPEREDYRNVYFDVMFEGHKFVKKLEGNSSSVSLRDFSRLDKLFSFCLAFVREVKAIEKSKESEFDSFEERWKSIESREIKQTEFLKTISLVFALNYYLRLYSDCKEFIK